jgi:mannose-6-phosphate isomerase-like protein (cupin superfamily)
MVLISEVIGHMEKEPSFFTQWLQREEVPVVRGAVVRDLSALNLAPHRRTGGEATWIVLDGTGGTNGALLQAIAPAGSLKPQKHLYECLIFVLEGRGATTVGYETGARQTFEWKRGSAFAIPLNATFEIHNASAAERSLYIEVSAAPLVLDLFRNEDFVFNNPYRFAERFQATDGYFSGESKHLGGRLFDTNFISDVRTFPLIPWNERGRGSNNATFEMADNALICHISEFPVGMYKKAHRHGPGAHVFIVSGEGYSIMWPDGGERQRYDWQDGSLIVPRDRHFHQHFNSGSTPARYFAIRWGGVKHPMHGLNWEQRKVDISLKAGGDQIEYEDQDPEIHQLFEEELRKRNVQPRMPVPV